MQRTLSPSGSVLRPLAAALLTFSAVAFVLYSVFFVAKSDSRTKRGWTLLVLMCSKWQPLYFLIVSMERLVLSVVVLSLALDGMSHHHDLCSNSTDNFITAAELVWTCAIVVSGISTICCDLDADFTPFLRRCAYFFLASCLVADAMGSFLWGPSASHTHVSIGKRLNFIADNGMRLVVVSQAVIALHFLFVSYRSRNGRGWAYASLRFTLDECGTVMLQRPSGSPNVRTLPAHCSTESARESMLGPESLSQNLSDGTSLKSGACFEMRRRFKTLQRKLVSQCRVFVIPCVKSDGAKEGAGPGVEIARPLFKMGCLKPLQRLADAHPMRYLCFGFFIAMLSLGSTIVFPSIHIQGIATLILNSFLLVMFLGFTSSSRYNFDRVAAKHVATSFRFATFIVLLAMFIALEARRAYLGIRSPLQTLAIAILCLFFCLCALIDCAPQFSAMFQIWVSVTTHSHDHS
jgi:hypothetical protein